MSALQLNSVVSCNQEMIFQVNNLNYMIKKKKIVFAILLAISNHFLFAQSEGDIFIKNSFIQNTITQYGAKYFTDICGYLLYNYDFCPDPYLPGSIYEIPSGKELQLARALSAKKGDYIAFVLDPGIIAIAKISDKYKLLKTVGNRNGYVDTSIDKIIFYLKKWESKLLIKVIGIGNCFIIVDILSYVIDYKSIANDMYNLSPEVVTLGTKSLSNLEMQIKKNKSIYLWWTYDYGFIK